MATYFSGSNIQADTMQTLYLMNPDYVGYPDMPAPGNMVLVNPSTGAALTNNNLVASGQPQQHFISIPFPPAPLPQRASMGTVENSHGTQQGIPSMSLPSRLGNNGYSAWRNMGNELTTMRANEPSQNDNQAFSGQANSFSYMGHQCVSEISPTGMKHTPMSSMPEQQLTINPNGLGLQLDKSHNSTANGQGLSLSLSPHQLSNMQLSCFQNQPTDSEVNCTGISQANSEENMNSTDRITSKWPGNLSSFQDSARDGMLGGKFLTSPGGPEPIKQIHYGYNAIGATEVPNSLTGSKYFKATQQLLEEVVNVGKGIKPDIAKHQKPQTWFGTAVDKKNNSTETSTNDGTASAITGPSTSTQEVKNEHGIGLTAADRQELQMKKAKLVAMLDEVDRRYRQYYHQLQIVVSTFEVAAGFGAAKTYTALALQRISRHFRSLRDAIAGQIRLTSKNLGEEDLTSNGKSETTRLRFVDQQLRQQRALQQLGMIQQHAWRPQRGLPERAVSILRAWLFEHFLHPYPKDADKHLLARQTGLTRSQVSNWFINARVRLWKPMVEEMYLEETREAEAETRKEDSRITESTKSKEETDLKGGGGISENEQEQKIAKSNRLDDHTEKQGFMQQNGSLDGVFKSRQDTNSINGRNQTINMDNGSNSHVFHEIPNEAIKKARNKIQDLRAFLPSNVTMDVDLKSGETEGEYVLDNSKFGSDERHASEGYNLLNNKMFQHDTNGNFGSYQFEGLGKYGHESFTPKFSGIGGGVSLTLGLQHCDDLSLSGTQQSYGSSQGLGLGRRHHLGSNSDDYCSINDTPAAHATSNYENIAMQNRKRFATHPLHDFVA